MTQWDMLNWIFFVEHVPVRHLLSSRAILYLVIAQLQMAHCSYEPFVVCSEMWALFKGEAESRSCEVA